MGVSLTIHRGRTVQILSAFLMIMAIGLVVFDLFVSHWNITGIGPLRRMANMGREDSFSGWYASQLFLVAGIIAGLIYLVVRAQDAKNKVRVISWGLISLFFLYLGVDDGAGLHERLGTSVRILLGGSEEDGSRLFGFPTYTWQLVFMPIFAPFAAFMLFFLWKELKTRRLKMILIAALGCFAFAVLMDAWEGTLAPFEPIPALLNINSDIVFHFGQVTEEFMETLGESLFIICFFSHLTQMTPKLEFRFAK